MPSKRTFKKSILSICVIAPLIFFMFILLKDPNFENDLEKLTRTKEQIIPWGQNLIGTGHSEGRVIKVAVLDSGINASHEDLTGKIMKQYNSLNQSRRVNDDFDHGTAVAGIITANDNRLGILGLNNNIEIYDIKVLNNVGKGKVDHLIDGIKQAIKEEVDIINISFGVQSDNQELKEAVLDACNKGIIIIAAAGNTYGLGMDYPAKYESVISVKSIDQNLKLTDSSASGEARYSAPGEEILSTNASGGYSLYSGSSFAAAYVTGSLSYHLGRYITDVKEINNARDHNEFLKYLDKIDETNSEDSHSTYKILKIN